MAAVLSHSSSALIWPKPDELKALLEEKFDLYNRPEFIQNDPISIPHQFEKKQDREIMGFLAAMLAWGQRKTILNKCNELIGRMQGQPYAFVMNHREKDMKALLGFKHRTFNHTDLLYFLHFFKWFYQRHQTLEDAFVFEMKAGDDSTRNGLVGFHRLFFSLDSAPARTARHVSTPLKKSACKRLNMFLRWMVRSDDKGVDFGIWNRIGTHQLICPCDVHVDRIARSMGLITRKGTDWETAIELTMNLQRFDAADPVKYDFALFGMGVQRWTQSPHY